MPTELPKKIGHYRIVRQLGIGAVGIVYEAIDPQQRPVALKVIRRELLEGADAEDVLIRFIQEAQSVQQFDHPNIVHVYELGVLNDLLFMAMELVEGRTLKQYLDEKPPLDLAVVERLMAELLGALEYSHSFGVVHRDIKPANIMLLPNGQIKVADFGLAKIETSDLTHHGDVMGTPGYMAPEQLAGESVDRRADLFAAGVLLYQLLTGDRPYKGNFVMVAHQIVNQSPPRPSEKYPALSTVFDPVVARALARDRLQRYQTAREFLIDFEQALKVQRETPVRSATAEPPPLMLAEVPMPKRFGHFEVKRQLGSSYSAVVYEAMDTQRKEVVALKVLRRQFLEMPEAADVLESFILRADSVSNLRHDNIAWVRECCIANDDVFIVKEEVDGVGLQRRFDEGTAFSREQMWNVLQAVLAALGHAHTNGITHGDLKPFSVLLLPDGRIKVRDFAIAQVETDVLTKTGAVPPISPYDSPEQVLCRVLDERADLYAVGVMFYRMLTGSLPFIGTSDILRGKILGQAPTPPSQVNPRVVTAFNPVIEKALAKAPERRFQCAADMLEALRPVLLA